MSGINHKDTGSFLDNFKYGNVWKKNIKDSWLLSHCLIKKGQNCLINGFKVHIHNMESLCSAYELKNFEFYLMLNLLAVSAVSTQICMLA